MKKKHTTPHLSLDQELTRRDRNLELRQRSYGAAIGHLIILGVLVANTPLLSEINASVIYIFMIAAANLLRLWMCRKNKKFNLNLGSPLWFQVFFALLLITAVGWSLVVHFLFKKYGFENTHTMLCYMFFAGLTAGAASSLSPSQKTAHAFTFTLLIVPTYDLLTSGTTQYVVMGMIFVFYFLFTQGQIVVQSDTFRKMKQSETQFRLLSSSMFEGVAIHSDGYFLEVNAAYAQLFGYSPSEMIGASIAIVMPEFERLRLFQIIRDNFEAPYEAKFRRKDGSLFFGESVGRNTLYHGRKARINCMRDISERVSAEENRKKTDREFRDMSLAREKHAIEASQIKSEFLANMSHELRTPLNGIIGTTELLLETELQPEQKKFSAVIRDSGETLLTIINDLLDFSKIEAGKLSLEKVEFSPVLLVESQIELLSAKAHAKKISLLAHIDPSIPDYLLGDPGRISQILVNLLGNALKFTQTGSVTVWVENLGKIKGEVKIKISVKDTGVGIAIAAMDKLFQPFSQADGSTARKFGGTGLGLSICRQLVKLMDGEIGVNSAINEGSEFWFCLNLEATGKKAEPRNSLDGLKVFIRMADLHWAEIIESYLRAWNVRAQILTQDEPIGRRTPCDLLMIGEPELSRGYNPLPEKTILLREFTATPYQRSPGMPAAALLKPIKQSGLYNVINKFCNIQVETETTPLPTHLVPARKIPTSGSQKRILVAEDNSINQMLAESNLQILGYRFRIVQNGNEVLQALAEESFDLILMDCHMPDLDGYDTTQIIRVKEQATQKHIPIIALTANAMKDDEQKCLDVGMDDYLSKPLRRKALELKLQKWLAAGAA